MVTPIPRVAAGVPADDVHGGAEPREHAGLGLRAEQVLDFSANVTPFGPPPAVPRAVQAAALDRYPDRACRELREALARRHGVGAEQVLVGNGSAEIIWLAAAAYGAPGAPVVVLGPTFGGYERAARVAGAEVVVERATAADDFLPPLAAFADRVRALRPRLAFVANPNNPTGQVVPVHDVLDLAARHADTLFVLDEAYADFVAPPARPGPGPAPNVLRLRSLTKAHGLAGLRLGYALGAPEVIAVLRTVQPPWSVNALAQAAGLAALADECHVRDGLARLTAAAAELVERLRAAGFAPVPSAVPFFLLPVGDAARTRMALLRRGILVRDCTSFGLPQFVRISSRRREENDRLVTALVQVREEMQP